MVLARDVVSSVMIEKNRTEAIMAVAAVFRLGGCRTGEPRGAACGWRDGKSFGARNPATQSSGP